MTTGIYKITNIKSNKIYIGSSKDIEQRWMNHKSMLKFNKHHSIHLQRAYNKYGEENFIFEILEECNQCDIIERENYYLKILLKSDEYLNGKSDFFIKNSYNICPLATKGFGKKQKRESILKQLKSRNISSILKININGDIIDEYEMMSDIDDNKCSILKSKKKFQCLKNKNYGYISKKDYYIGYKPKQLIAWNKNTKLDIIKNKKEIFVYDIYGRFYKTFDSVKSTCEYFKFHMSAISPMLNKWERIKIGKTSEKSLYRFFTTQQFNHNLLSFNNKYGNIEIYTLFDEKLGYSTIGELVTLLNVKKASIQEVLNGRRIQCKFYKFKYREDIV